MSTNRKSSSSGGAGGRRPNVESARKWVAQETRAEAKELFTQHTRETSNLDVLSRCKKLNELLNSDVLKGKGNSKEQLKEILGILHAGPKRPSILDKPPITATAGKRAAQQDRSAKSSLPASLSAVDPDAVLGLLAEEAEDSVSRSPRQAHAAPSPQEQQDDVDDLIGLLNDAPAASFTPCVSSSAGTLPSGSQAKHVRQAGRPQDDREPHAAAQREEAESRAEEERQLAQRRAQEAAERERQAREAAEAERQQKEHEAREEGERRRRAEEARAEAERQRIAREEQEKVERQRREQEEQERQREAREAQEEAERQRAAAAAAAAEALRQERLRHGAALCIQSQWRAFCARRLAAQLRQRAAEERAAEAAACVLQAAWRARQASHEYRELRAAARTLQCAVRAWRARQCLQKLRVEAFARQHAARVVQRAFRAYRARYTLGPLRVPTRGGARPMSGVDAAALLAKQLRLRSAVDQRLAPERRVSGAPANDEDAGWHRTVITHRERVREVSATERHYRAGLGERTIMVASEHRDSAEALSIARQGAATAAPPPPLPSAPGTPPDGALRHSRSGSRSGRPSDPEGARWTRSPGTSSGSLGRALSRPFTPL